MAPDPFDSIEVSLLSAALELALARNHYTRAEITPPQLLEAETDWNIAVGLFSKRGHTVAALCKKLVAHQVAAYSTPTRCAGKGEG